jgi:threonine aldolase
MRVVDLRSDTLTHPTEEMRRAMAAARVGDDVFGEDPTVNELEARAATLLGKEAALFVTSGTMANLVSLMAHCGRGDEVILGDQSHTFLFEQGGCAAVGGIHPRTVPNRPDGTMRLDDLEAAIRPDNIHFPRTRLITLENTHNRCYGSPLDRPYLRSVRALADRNGLAVHVDGARLFNAAAALAVAARDLAEPADSVSFCLSKGLCAPVGSLVCGRGDFIDRARRLRKVLGGGMRQAGVLAAAGLVALDRMVGRLAEDHANALTLAEGLSTLAGLRIDLERVRTNLVFIDVVDPDWTAPQLVERLSSRGVKVLAAAARRVRAVTHNDVSAEDIDHAIHVFQAASASG